MTREFEVGRYEYKYAIPLERRGEVLEAIAAHTVPDPNATRLQDGSVGYHVRTLYFDTPALYDYFQRLEAARVRNRPRIRTYGEDPSAAPVFLENKRKSSRWVVKHREVVGCGRDWLGHGDPQPWQVIGAADGLRSYAVQSFRSLVDEGQRVPVTLVRYDREVFVPLHPDPNDHVRLTLDRNLYTAPADSVQCLFASGAEPLVAPGWMVMELKFLNRPPRWMFDLRRRLNLAACPVSKFGLSVALLLRSARAAELRRLAPPQLRPTGCAA